MIKEKEVFVNGLKTNYKIAGQGPEILILHGWNGSSDSWRKVIEILSKDFLVICPDFPGFGKSQIPNEAWDLKNYTYWLLNFVNFLKLNSFFLLGHSFGGRVAIKFSIFYPERVKKLILVSSAGIRPKLGLKGKLIFSLAKFGNLIFNLKPLNRFKEKVQKFFYFFFSQTDYAKAKGVMKETMKRIVEEDLFPFLSQINSKTLLIWGQKDKLVPLKYAFFFREKIKNSQLKILPKIGHSPHLEAPEKLAKVIFNFLKNSNQ